MEDPFDIYEEAIKAGFIHGVDMGHHESDLYLLRDERSIALKAKYLKVHPHFRITTFIGTDRKAWYEFPFDYAPFWKSKEKKLP